MVSLTNGKLLENTDCILYVCFFVLLFFIQQRLQRLICLKLYSSELLSAAPQHEAQPAQFNTTNSTSM